MSQIDFNLAHASLYAPSKTPVLIEVPPLRYLMFNGRGEVDRTQALEALGSLAYTLKFMSRASFGRDYAVGPFERLLNAGGTWTQMILQPDWIFPDMLKAARAEAFMKSGLPGLERVRLENLEEGLCAQGLSLDGLPKGLLLNGPRHEIVLKSGRTLLRQPVRWPQTAIAEGPAI
ncbi:MAG TPA: hypothetical protein VG839_08055 [Asticcacaulis sp.]|nr:hypothetical protein [Asticcacaulis sp.]